MTQEALEPTRDASAEARTSSLPDLLEQAVRIKAQIDAAKPLYDELEKVTLNIVSCYLAAGGEATAPTGHIVQVVDNFAGANTVFRPAAVKRFELKIMTPDEYAYSRMSKSEKAAYTRAKNGGGNGVK